MTATACRTRSLLAIALLLTLGSALRAEPKAPLKLADLIDFKIAVLPPDPFAKENEVGTKTIEFRRGEVAQLVITGTPKPGYHTYPIGQRAPRQPEPLSSIKYEPSPGLQPLWPVHESVAEKRYYKAPLDFTLLEYDRTFTWSQDILVLPTATPGTLSLRFSIDLQVCNDAGCTPGVLPYEVKLNVSAAPPVPLTPELEKRRSVKQEITIVEIPGEKAEAPAVGKSETKSASMGDNPDQHKADLEALLKLIETPKTKGSTDLLGFILAGIFWGGVSLITPCVFPMIPITVSFFLKQSEKQHHKPVTMALVYSGTIIVVLTIAAVALLSTFRELSVSPWMNFFLGALFIFFALSLFGMYEIELPSSLARFTSSREGKGGLVGTMFMALTFTIISFACVAPFLGGFGGTAAASRPTFLQTVFGGLAFSVTFASPFFILALFPTLLKQMPKSGSWLNSVKVVMGFLELAAALKFFRAGELVWLPQPVLFTYDFVLGLYVALSLLCGAYLLGLYRLPHDTPAEHLGVPRLMFSLAFIGLAFYLAPALLKTPDGQGQRPGGAVFAWLESFLLPETGEVKGDLPWSGNLKKVLDEAREEYQRTGKPQFVFVDFTGETCTNCKINERTVFIKPEIRGLFQKYHLVQLYTDKVPNRFYSPDVRARFGNDVSRQSADAKANLWFEKAAFNDEQLPLYVILKPELNGKIEVVGKYDEGKINNDSAFAQFLKTPLDGGAAMASVGGQ
jgi:thiol:disulfide interchange protein DsbD